MRPAAGLIVIMINFATAEAQLSCRSQVLAGDPGSQSCLPSVAPAASAALVTRTVSEPLGQLAAQPCLGLAIQASRLHSAGGPHRDRDRGQLPPAEAAGPKHNHHLVLPMAGKC